MNDINSVFLPERQQFERVEVFLSGQLFDPESEMEWGCKVRNLSAEGAAIEIDWMFQFAHRLVLYIDEFGRFEVVAIGQQNGELAMQFVIGAVKRQRLSEMIDAFTVEGLAGVTQLRKHARVSSNVNREIVREDGERLPCQVVDISIEGASLRTQMRPLIGETVVLGQSRGRVVRHHQDGIAIQYIHEKPSTA